MREFAFLFILLSLSGCIALAAPIEFAIDCMDYEKNVSNDPKYANMIGKKFILKQDVALRRCTPFCFFFDPYIDRDTFPPNNDGIVSAGTEFLVVAIIKKNLSNTEVVLTQMEWNGAIIKVLAFKLMKKSDQAIILEFDDRYVEKENLRE